MGREVVRGVTLLESIWSRIVVPLTRRSTSFRLKVSVPIVLRC